MDITNELPAKFAMVFLATFMCILSLAHAGLNSMDVGDLHAGEFDVKPGGSVHEFEQSWEGVTCMFTYACQGGTKEQWLMKLTRSTNQREYKCSVERPGQQPSYLFFQQFNVKVSGGTIQEGAGDGQPGKPLKPEEYAIDSSSNSFGHVEGKFEAHLNKVEVYFTSGNKEL